MYVWKEAVINVMKEESNAKSMNVFMIKTNLKKGKACVRAVT